MTSNITNPEDKTSSETNASRSPSPEFHERKDYNVVLRVVVLFAASVIFSLNIKTFVHTGGLLPGGATGLTLLIQEICQKFLHFSIPYTAVNLAINAVPVYIGFRFIGKRFTLFSCLVILLTGFLTDLLPSYTITNDILLISVFGGIINGAAVSLCLLMDATSGGTDFISIFLSEKRGIDSFNVSLGINASILIIGGILFGWDKALYSIIFQYASTTIIRLLYRKYQQATLFIVTNKPSEISALISGLTNHSSTILHGEGSYLHEDKPVVYSIVSGAEANKVVDAIKKEDPAAFVNVMKTERILGRFYRRPED